MSDKYVTFPAADDGQDDIRWFAVRVRSNFEATTSAAFRNRGLESFNPTYGSTRQWSDRVRELELPLFPGYVFCRFTPSKSLLVRSSPGVVHIVSAGHNPIPVDDHEVESVRSICRSGLLVRPAEPVAIGQRVVVVKGPLQGVEGTVVRLKEGQRLIAAISLLQRAVSVELDNAWIEVVEDAIVARPANIQASLLQVRAGRAKEYMA